MARTDLTANELNELVALLSDMQLKLQRLEALGSLRREFPWKAQRAFILQVCEWQEFGSVSHKQFRDDHKDLQMLFALHRNSSGGSSSEDPYASGGAFGGSGGEGRNRPQRQGQQQDRRGGGDRGGGDRNSERKCYNCQQYGHISRNCTKRRREGGDQGGRSQNGRTCFLCGSADHLARNCDRRGGQTTSGGQGAPPGGAPAQGNAGNGNVLP